MKSCVRILQCMLLALLIAVSAYSGASLASTELGPDCQSASDMQAHDHALDNPVNPARTTDAAGMTHEVAHCGIHVCAALVDVTVARACSTSMTSVARGMLPPAFVLVDLSNALHRPPKA